MNAKTKIHQAKLASWTDLIKQQSNSGLTVKEWCSSNNISIHAFFYWKRALKETIIDSALPEIVPILQAPATNATAVVPSTVGTTAPSESAYSHNLCNSRELPSSSRAVSITLGDVRIEIGETASDEIISGIIKAVRHV